MRYRVARTLADVTAALAETGDDLLVVGGGTDLMVRSREAVRDRAVLDVSRVTELRRVELDDGELVLGAGVTYTDCLESPMIRRAAPLLVAVAERFASPPIRNTATLGGNVANASPAGDGVAALWALDARVGAVTPEGPVRASIEAVVRGPGRLGLPPRSVITTLRVPAALPGEGVAFRKLVNRAQPEHPMAISVASVAVRLRVDTAGRVQLARVVLGAVAPTPVRAARAEALLLGALPTAARLAAAGDAVVDAARPVSDLRAGAGYRRAVLPALAAAALTAALAGARAAEARHG